MSFRSTMNPRHLGIGVMVASAALGVSFAGATPAYPASTSAANPAAAAPSAPSAAVIANTLVITGTNGADQIAVAGSNADPNALDVDLGTSRLRFDRNTFTAISVALHDGDDQFTEAAGVFADKPVTVDAGSGDDHIVTGDGNDLIYGGHGDDTILSGKGDDTIFGDGGNDFADGLRHLPVGPG
jgi:Ca2+-binding RTX toxin-like protein